MDGMETMNGDGQNGVVDRKTTCYAGDINRQCYSWMDTGSWPSLRTSERTF